MTNLKSKYYARIDALSVQQEMVKAMDEERMSPESLFSAAGVSQKLIFNILGDKDGNPVYPSTNRVAVQKIADALNREAVFNENKVTFVKQGKEVKQLSFEDGVGAKQTRTELIKLWRGLVDMLGLEAQEIEGKELETVLDVLEILLTIDRSGKETLRDVLENIKTGKIVNTERLKVLETISKQLK